MSVDGAQHGERESVQGPGKLATIVVEEARLTGIISLTGAGSRRMASVEGERKLTTILAADVVGLSKLAGADEERTLARLRALRSDLIDPTIALHHGRIVKRTGDGTIVEFRSVVGAARCAIELQSAMVDRNAGLSPNQRIVFRVGIHLGDVVEEADGDLMGDGVNVAARLESSCEPGGVCLSGAAYEQVRDKLKETFVDLGEKQLKNIARPVRAFALSAVAIAAGASAARATKGAASRRGGARSPRRCSSQVSRQAATLGVRGLRRVSWPLPSTKSSPMRRASRSSCCRSRIWAATRSRTISPTRSPRT
jgi:class 3 adenylate cyclase